MWWTLLTYLYNALLIAFIATHLFVGAIISFLVGLYVGIYITQTYRVPTVSEPTKIWGKLLKFMEQYKIQKNGRAFRPRELLGILKNDEESSQEKQHDNMEETET